MQNKGSEVIHIQIYFPYEVFHKEILNPQIQQLNFEKDLILLG